MGDFVLGINYPWIACGHDFGPRPIPWAGAKRTDWSALERDLKELAAIGVGVVRFWILADGVNYPVGRPPQLNMEAPELPGEFLDDFASLFRACRAARVRLIPSFTSFEMFFPIEEKIGGVLARGRAVMVSGKNERLFFDRALEPLLDIAAAHREALYAFEVMNEPDWIVLGIDGEGPHWPAELVSSFLAEGARRIAARGLIATIGFSRADPTWLAPSVRELLIALAARGAYIHQAHFYAKVGRRARLPEASGILPCLLGEMPTARAERWADPELRTTEAEDDYLEARLALAKKRGYCGALLWSKRATDDQTRWDASTSSAVAGFALTLRR